MMTTLLLAALFVGDVRPEYWDGLQEVNALRATYGLPAFEYDPDLTAAAAACAFIRAEYLCFGHTANDFGALPAGCWARSSGCAAYPPQYGWYSCGKFDRYRYAGAAWVMGRDGRRYMHIFVR